VDARKCFWKLKNFFGKKEKKEVWKSNKRKEEREFAEKNSQSQKTYYYQIDKTLS